MLPSKASPTISPFAFTIGLPELPPTMSLSVVKFARVDMSRRSFAAIQRGGILNGGSPVARSKARDSSVHGRTSWPFSVQPFMRAVGEAQREGRVRIDARAVLGEARLRDLLLAALRRPVDLFLELLAERPRIGVHRGREA